MNELFRNYHPGHSPLHKAPLWIKWTAIFALTILCAVTSSWLVPLLGCLVVIALGSLAGISGRDWTKALWSIRWLLAAMSFYYVFFGELAKGTDILLTLITLICASKVLLYCTPMPRVIDGFVGFCQPLKILGISPHQIGLAIGLMIRTIPIIMDNWVLLQTSVKARGIKVSPTRLFIPLVISIVGFAHETGDALAARGLESPTNK